MQPSSVFQKEETTLSDVLEDIAFIISSGKYAKHFAMKGMFVLASALRGNVADEKFQ